MHAQFVLFDGFDPLDVIAPYEVLHTAGIVSGGAVSAELVSAEGARPVPSSIEGLTLNATGRLDPYRADLVLVPGSAPSGDELEAAESSGYGQLTSATRALREQAPQSTLLSLLTHSMRQPGTTVAAVCGGSLLLAMTGLLSGRRATTHHLGMDLLGAAGVHVVSARVVDDGDLVTSAGVTSGLDLALHLVERELGPRIVHSVEILLAYERRGTVWRPRGSLPKVFGDPRPVR
ncbi:DJ-1/PfpI family protein [Streptomyces luteireticuli]|uniref:DJ-1/PfpI family protein n=1 Tax=Streptomyces luteireticuli TaxID=173858 RepID=A0ABP3IE34_9ACTN